MRKRTIIITIAALLAIAAAILCFVPRITRFDEVMIATKLDANGNELGTVTFRVQANKQEYLFLDTRFSCRIPDFDTLCSFEQEERVPQRSKEYCFTVTSAVASAKDIVMCDLYSSPDLERWLLWNRNDGTFYVASSDPNLTAAELVDYFKSLTNKITIAPVVSSGSG